MMIVINVWMVTASVGFLIAGTKGAVAGLLAGSIFTLWVQLR